MCSYVIAVGIGLALSTSGVAITAATRSLTQRSAVTFGVAGFLAAVGLYAANVGAWQLAQSYDAGEPIASTRYLLITLLSAGGVVWFATRQRKN